MRRDDESAVPGPEPRHVVEGPHRLGRGPGEIEEEHVPPLNGALDAGDQRDAAFPRVIPGARITELSFVQGNGECVEPKGGGAIDQRHRAMRDGIHRIVSGVKMKVYFQHALYL